VRCSIHFLNFFYCENREENCTQTFPQNILRLKDWAIWKRKGSYLNLFSIHPEYNLEEILPTKIVASKSEEFVSTNLLYQTLKSWISGYYLLANDLLEFFKCDCLLDLQEQNLKKSRQIFFGNEESRWKTICLKPLQKPFSWCTLLAKRGVLKIQTTSEQFSIFTQNSLKYSRHTKFFDLACVTVTQFDRSCRRCQSLPTLSLSFQGLLKSSHHSWLSHMGKWSSLSECKMKLEK